MTIHLFISECLIAVALYTKVKQGGGSANERMKESDLTTKVAFLSQFLRGEFIFPAGQGLKHNLDAALQRLLRDDVLNVSQDGERSIGLSDAERKSGRENFDFYCFLLWPFMDAGWLAAVSLLCLVPLPGAKSGWVDMQKAQNCAQSGGRTLYHQGDLSYFESINKEALKNVYVRFQEEGILEVAKSPDAKSGQTVRIVNDWLPERDPETGEIQPYGRLWSLIENLSQYRREGKNRRDGEAVAVRVSALASKLNKQMFAEDELATVEEATQGSPGHSRRRSKL
jgi:hypothetical protein